MHVTYVNLQQRRKLHDDYCLCVHGKVTQTSCRWAAATVCPAPLLPRGRRSALRRRADGNVAAVSHGHHVLTPTSVAA